MFLHVGNNKNIREKDIIGIFDMDNATVSTITRKFLNTCQKKNAVESTNFEIPKSFVMYNDGEDVSICFSQLSSTSLYGRISYLNNRKNNQ